MELTVVPAREGTPNYFLKRFLKLLKRKILRLNSFILVVRKSVVAVRRAGAIHSFHSLNNFFLINEMIVIGSSYWNAGIGREKGEVKSLKFKHNRRLQDCMTAGLQDKKTGLLSRFSYYAISEIILKMISLNIVCMKQFM